MGLATPLYLSIYLLDFRTRPTFAYMNTISQIVRQLLSRQMLQHFESPMPVHSPALLPADYSCMPSTRYLFRSPLLVLNLICPILPVHHDPM